MLALLAFALVGAYQAAPWLVAKYVPSIAATYGIEITSLEIARPGWTGVTIEQLAAQTSDVSVVLRDGRIGYRLRELIDGQLGSLEVARAHVVVAQSSQPGAATQPRAATANSGSTPAPFDPASLFGLVPFQRLVITELTTELPALDFRSAGSLMLQDGLLSVEATGLAPAAAEDLRLSGKFNAQGLIELELSTSGARGQRFVTISSLIEDGALAVTAQVDASGFPFTLLSAAAGMPAGQGRVAGQAQTRLPWPVDPQDVFAADISGEFQLDWQSADGSMTVSELAGSAQRRGAAIQAAFSAGEVKYDDAENLVIATIDEPVRADWDGAVLQVSSGISYRLRSADVALNGEVDNMMFAPEDEQPLSVELGATVQIDDLVHSGEMTLAAALTDSRIRADGVWTTAGWSLPFQVVHNLSSGQGQLTSTSELILDKPLAASLLPPWQELYDLDAGTLRYSAVVSWADETVLTMDVGLDDVRATYDDYLLSGVSADLQLSWQDDSLTLAPAEVTARLFDPGVPFTNLQSTVALNDDLLSVSDTEFELLGGRVSVGPFSYDLSKEQTLQPMIVELQKLALDQLLALEGEDISGHGLISGQLPIEIRGGLPSIPSGEVVALDPGGLLQLSDDYAGVSGQAGLDFVLAALTNYQFTSLVAGVEYSEDGELKLAIALQGSNPEVENGRPIHYNLNITENVRVLLRSLRAQRVVTDSLERRVLN